MTEDWLPLIDYKREGLSEISIYGALAWVSGHKLIHSYGGSRLCYGRSLMKPFQLKIFSKDLDDVLSNEAKAVSLASHNAEPVQIKAVESVLKPSDLILIQTPLSSPLMSSGDNKICKKTIYHPCSGKHAALLRVCEIKNWSKKDYLSPEHRLHQSYLKFLKNILGDSWLPQVTAKDGCGLPTLSMTLEEMATLYSTLAVEKDEDWIWESFVAYPDIIGGANRLDSCILKSCKGKVLAKEGADGLLGLSILHEDYPEGLGIVIKIAHGWDMMSMRFIASRILGVLNFSLDEQGSLGEQKPFLNENIIPVELRKNINFR